MTHGVDDVAAAAVADDGGDAVAGAHADHRRAGSAEAPESRPNPRRESWTKTNFHRAPRPA